MRGRKPTSIKTVPEDAITVAPRAPSWLSKDAKAEWKRVVPLLVDRGVLTNGDLGSLESYCVAVGTVCECQRALNKEGMFQRDLTKTVTKDGKAIITDKGFKRHPAIGVMNTSMTIVRQYAAELGLTPVSRSRPNITDARDLDEDSPLDL